MRIDIHAHYWRSPSAKCAGLLTSCASTRAPPGPSSTRTPAPCSASGRNASPPAQRRARWSRLLGRPPEGAPLVLGGTSPHARGDSVVYRPGQARGLRWAGPADPFSLVDLAPRGPHRADREEEVCIGVTAGGVVTPVGTYGHRAGSRGRDIRSAARTPFRPVRQHQAKMVK